MRPDEDRKRFIDTIGNVSRIKILYVLWRSRQELRIYRICHLTGLGRSSARHHLNKLVKNELVVRKIYGQVILYSVNKNNPRLNALVDFFKATLL